MCAIRGQRVGPGTGGCGDALLEALTGEGGLEWGTTPMCRSFGEGVRLVDWTGVQTGRQRKSHCRRAGDRGPASCATGMG